MGKNWINGILIGLIVLVSGAILFTGNLLITSKKNQVKAQTVTNEQVQKAVAAMVLNQALNKNANAAANTSENLITDGAAKINNDLSKMPPLTAVFTSRDTRTEKDTAVFANLKQNNFRALVPADYNYDYTLNRNRNILYYYKFTEIGQNSVWKAAVQAEGEITQTKLFDIAELPITFFPAWDETYFVMLERVGTEAQKIVVYDLAGKAIKQLNLKGQIQILGWVDKDNLLILHYPPTNAKRMVMYNLVNDNQVELAVSENKYLGMDTALLSPSGKSIILTVVSRDNLNWSLYRYDILTEKMTLLLELKDQPVTYYDWSTSGEEVLIASREQLWRCPIAKTCSLVKLAGLTGGKNYSYWLEDTQRVLLVFDGDTKQLMVYKGADRFDFDLAPLKIADIRRSSVWSQ